MGAKERHLQAADAGDVEAVISAMGDGADVDFADAGKRTALMYAAYGGELAVVRLLLELEAEPDLKSGADFTALDYALKAGEVECAQALHARGAKTGDLASVVSFVCDAGKPELVRIVLAPGPTLDVLAGNGAAPLHYAAMRGHLEAAGLLLEAGADPALQTSTGLSALGIAQQRGDAAMIALLGTAG